MKRKVLAVLLSAAMICTPADVQVFAEEGVTDVYESETQEETQEETSDEKAADEESESGEVQEERSVPETTKAETPDLDGESETAATEVLTEEQTHGRMWHRKLRQRRNTSRLYWRRRTSWTAGKSRSFRGQLTVQGSLQLQEQGITAIRAKCSLMTPEAHLGISVVKKLLPQKSMFPL